MLTMVRDISRFVARACRVDLHTLALTHTLVWLASLAGLVYDFRVLPRGVRLTFGGYNDKLANFAAYISKKLSKSIADVLPKNDHEFDRYKDEIMRALSAFDVKQPYAHATYYAQLTLQPRRFQYSNKELRDATRKMTLPDLVEYANSIWASGRGEALVQGNFDEAEALRLVETIGDAIPFRPISDAELPPYLEALPLPTSRALSLPARLLVAEPNPSRSLRNCSMSSTPSTRPFMVKSLDL